MSAGLKQDDLASILNITKRHVAHIEAGERGLVPELAVILSERFSKTLDYIYTGETSKGDNLDPVCKLVMETMDNINNPKRKDFYRDTVINLSHAMRDL